MSREERNKLRGIFEKALREDGSKEMFDAVVKTLCLFHRAQREEMLVVVGKFARTCISFAGLSIIKSLQ